MTSDVQRFSEGHKSGESTSISSTQTGTRTRTRVHRGTETRGHKRVRRYHVYIEYINPTVCIGMAYGHTCESLRVRQTRKTLQSSQGSTRNMHRKTNPKENHIKPLGSIYTPSLSLPSFPVARVWDQHAAIRPGKRVLACSEGMANIPRSLLSNT